MRIENAEVWCVLAQINDNINIEKLQKSEPTIDFCMQKLGSNNIDSTPHSRKWGGVNWPPDSVLQPSTLCLKKGPNFETV